MNTLVDQVEYDRWANLQMLDAVSKTRPETLTLQIGSSFPSIHETLVHILWAEELWLQRWQSLSNVPFPDPNNFPTLDALRRKLEEIHEQQIHYLKSLEHASADRVVGYVNFKGQRWEYSLRQMVQHLMVHSAYHRGQIATMLRQMGETPPMTDYLVFVDSKSA